MPSCTPQRSLRGPASQETCFSSDLLPKHPGNPARSGTLESLLPLSSCRIRLQTIASAFPWLSPLLAVARAALRVKSAAAADKLGDLFTGPVDGEEDAELIWLIGRSSDAAAGSIWGIHAGCLSEYRCMAATVSAALTVYRTYITHLEICFVPLKSIREYLPFSQWMPVIYSLI